jgi:chloramphenicol O-acetyltransferase type B
LIGFEALIMSGVTIDDGAVVGARSVVTKDIPPYGIVAGNPGRLIRKRFEDEVIYRLLNIQWWNWNDDKIEALLPLLFSGSMETFLFEAEKQDYSMGCVGSR